MAVTARDLIAEAERRGARFEVIGDRLRAGPKYTIDAELYRAIGERKVEVIDELRRRGEAVVAAQRLLRLGQWPPVVGTCAFHIGVPGAVCRRCGAPWFEHEPIRSLGQGQSG